MDQNNSIGSRRTSSDGTPSCWMGASDRDARSPPHMDGHSTAVSGGGKDIVRSTCLNVDFLF